MRVKAIPQAAVKAISNPWVLGGGAAVLAVAAFLYVRGQATPVENTEATGQSYNALGGYAPVSLGGASGGVSDAVTGAITDGISGAAGMAELIGLQTLTAGYDYDLGIRQIQANADAVLINADIAFAGIQSSNFAIQANLANTFANSSVAALFGSIGGPTGDLNLNLYAARDNGSDNAHDRLRNLINSGAIATANNQAVRTTTPAITVTNGQTATTAATEASGVSGGSGGSGRYDSLTSFASA